MSITLVKKRITPKRLFNVPKIRDRIETAIRATEKDIRKDYESITATWKHKPDIEGDTELRGIDATLLVGTDDKIFNYLDKGTKVRYALMYPGYKRKTKVGSLKSKAGGGNVRYIGKARPYFYSKRKKWPLKGIKARGWTKIIHGRAVKSFQERVTKAAKDSVKFV